MADDKNAKPQAGDGGAGGGDPNPPKANPFAGIAFAIEFGGPNNENTLCPITRRKYRGKWVMSNVKGRVPEDFFSRMPDLPGHMLVIDGKSRTVTFLDPLDKEGFREVLAEAQSVLQGRGWGDEPDEEEVLTNCPDDVLKEYIYWCRRWVDNAQAAAINGTKVPEMKAVEALPGKVRYNQFEMSNSGKRDSYPNMADIPPYRAPTPPKVRKMKREKRRRDNG